MGMRKRQLAARQTKIKANKVKYSGYGKGKKKKP